MSDRPQRPTGNRRPNPSGSTPPGTSPEPTEATPASEPAASSVPGTPEPSTPAGVASVSVSPGDRAEATTGGRPEPSAPIDAPATAAPQVESPGAAGQDYPELSAPASEPDAATRFGEPRPAAPFREGIPPAAASRESGYRGLALGLMGALLLALALIATAPFWAPLLPWGDQRAGTDPAIVERLDAEQQQIQRLEQQMGTASSATPQLAQRVAALEQKPPPSPPDLGEMRTQIAALSSGTSELTGRVERLENSVQAQASGLSELKAGLEQLDKTTQAQAGGFSDLRNGLEQLGRTTQAQSAGISDLKTGLEQLGRSTQAQQQALAADFAAKLNPVQQGLQATQSAIAALGNRLQAFEKTAQSRAGDLTDMGLVLALMQIRDAVENGTPFPAQYNALSSLAKNRPEIAAAATPLADAARTGTADRAELAQELSALRQQLDAAPAASDAQGGWTGAALDRLRGLVRIRRADEADPGKQAMAAISVAERALAGGDLPRAVAAIETLQGPGQGSGQGPGQGPAASAVADWLRKARERLAVEGALHRLEALLTTRLGDTAPSPAPAPAPGAPG